MWYDPRPGAYGPSDPGGGAPTGENIEDITLRWWYEEGDGPGERPDLSWPTMLSHWDAIETDFHIHYHCDLGDGILDHRSWRWFRIRLIRLLAEESHLARVLGLREHKKT